MLTKLDERSSRRQVICQSLAGGVLAGLAAPGGLLAAPSSGPGGFSPARLARIDDAMQAAVAAHETPGMVGLIYRHGTLAYATTAGWRDIAANAPMQRDTIFQIMSMTKPITATAVLTLIDEGRISLYDPVDKYLPEFANLRVLRTRDSALDDTIPIERPITILDLLTYRSGLGSEVAGPAPITKAIHDLYTVNRSDADAWLKGLTGLPLWYQPGTGWAYETASDVLAILIHRVTGTPFADFLRERIFDPLGMRDTAHFVPPDKRDRFAVLYKHDPANANGFIPSGLDFPDAAPTFARAGRGLASTADDYLQFARMLLGGGEKDGVRILSYRMASLMTTNYLTADQRAGVPPPVNALFKGLGWGLGLAVVVDPGPEDENNGFGSLGTFSWAGAFGTWWQVDPKEDMIQIYMHQLVTDTSYVVPRITFQRMGYEAIED